MTVQAQIPAPVEVHDIQYGETGGVPLIMDIVQPAVKPARPVPAVVMIHGGGWGEGSREPMLERARLAAEHGYVAATISYRLAGIAPFPAQLQDCKCAVRFLRANAIVYGIDPQRIAAWGCSAGGHLAAMLGLTENLAEFEGDGGCEEASSAVQMVIDCYGPSDLPTWQEAANKLARDPAAQRLFGPSGPDKNLRWQDHFSLKTDKNIVAFLDGKTDERAAWASSVTYAAGKGTVPPFLIVHGTQDAWVPLQQSVLLADTLDAHGVDVTLLVKPNMGHDEVKAFPEIIDYLQKRFPLN